MKDGLPFRTYSSYLKERYGESVFRLAMDPGFPCPEREGDRCSYCHDDGARAAYLDGVEDPRRQIARGRDFVRRRYGARSFILYVQAHTPTNTDPGRFCEVLDLALGEEEYREIVVATRPDCFNADWAKLLAGYSRPDRRIWVELGLQSANEATLARVNRGHGLAAFESAFEAARTSGLLVGVHVILGLPGEDLAAMRRTAEYLAGLRPEGVKLHNLVLVEGTALYHDYLAGASPWRPPDGTTYVAMAADFLARLPPEVIVLRMVCDPPRGLVTIPGDFPPKAQVPDLVAAELSRRGLRQGSLASGGVP